MDGVGEVRVSAGWLGLREPADAAARAVNLAERVRPQRPAEIHDLGSGTGSMLRWLAPRLDGPQRWLLCDRDGDLLARAATGAPPGVTVQTRQCDVTHLSAADLAAADLVTASALLDMLTADELDRIVGACAAAGRPALFTLSVVGRVELTPSHPLDAEIGDAFNDHQRRTADGRALLGPDAVDAAAAGFASRGWRVLRRPSPWRLGPAESALTAEWFAGWLGAARAQRPDLVSATEAYEKSRLAQAAAGALAVVVGHEDLLATPDAGSGQTHAE